MKLEIIPYIPSCELEIFKINDINANADDFGYSKDLSPETAPEYGCGNRQFILYDDYEKSLQIQHKYNITYNEYEYIRNELVDKLSIGCCDFCNYEW